MLSRRYRGDAYLFFAGCRLRGPSVFRLIASAQLHTCFITFLLQQLGRFIGMISC